MRVGGSDAWTSLLLGSEEGNRFASRSGRVGVVEEQVRQDDHASVAVECGVVGVARCVVEGCSGGIGHRGRVPNRYIGDKHPTVQEVTERAELRIVRLEDVPWQEVKAQQHGTTRVSVWEKYLEWTPERLTLYGRYDPGMVIERHRHRSDHLVHVIEGEIAVDGVACGAGTTLFLPLGAAMGPIEAGPEGAVLFEVMLGDPRAVPADPDGFAALLADRGVVALPNPPIEAPPWFGARTDGDPGA